MNSGDRNTHYFHMVTKTRRARNRILSILDHMGVYRRGDKDIAAVAIKYFEDLYTAEPAPEEEYRSVFQGFQAKITDEINMDLTRPVTIDEIKNAVFAIGPHRPDGFSESFYHQYWNEIQPSIFEEVQSFFANNHLEHAHNHTNLCLLSKIKTLAFKQEKGINFGQIKPDL